MRALAWITAVVGWSCTAFAEPGVTLRLATIAPDGTAWARELRAFARDVESETKGSLKVKWYFGGIAGDEIEVDDRMARGQVDGVASGGMLCLRHSTTMRTFRLLGLVQTAEEAQLILNRLREQIASEFSASGFEFLGAPIIGTDLLFLNRLPTNLAELRQMKLWRWDLDADAVKYSRAIGLDIAALPVGAVSRTLDDKQLDGVVAVPAAALAFQWASRTKVLVRLPLGVLPGCFVITQRAFSRLTVGQQQLMRAAAAKAVARFTDLGIRQDEALLGSLFEKQGLRVMPPPDLLRNQFLSATRAQRDRITTDILPRGTMTRVLELLADYRAERGP